jgi:hypothetical protein
LIKQNTGNFYLQNSLIFKFTNDKILMNNEYSFKNSLIE